MKDKTKNKPLFAYCKPFCFAWYGGRLLIMNSETLDLVDFGDGGMSRGGDSTHLKKVIRQHSVLGSIEADKTFFKLLNHNIEFDFNTLRNCNWLDKNKEKKKERK